MSDRRKDHAVTGGGASKGRGRVTTDNRTADRESCIRRLANIGMAVMAAGVVGYVALRASLMDMTYDESHTVLTCVPQTVREVITMAQPNANNHVLNTLAIKVVSSLCGFHEWSCRLPNVAAGALYCVCCMALCRRLRHPWWGLTVFACLVGNPYVLDFFSVGRGYGISLAFIMLSMLLLDAYREGGRLRDLWGCLGACAVAVYANVCAIPVYMGVLCGAIASGSRRVPRTAWLPQIPGSHWTAIGCVSLILGVCMVPVVWRPMQAGGYTVGGTEGFIADTVRSLVVNTLYGVPYGDATRWIARCLYAIVLGGTGLSVALCVAHFWRAGLTGAPDRTVAVGMVVCCAAGMSVGLHYTLGLNYLRDRLAVYFIPLFLTMVGAAVDRSVESRLWWRRVVAASSALCVLAIGSHFARSANMSSVLEWRYDQQNCRVLKTIAQDWTNHDRKPVLGVSFLMGPSIHYYMRHGNAEIGACIMRGPGESFRGTDCDYFYLKDGLHENPLAPGETAWVRLFPDAGTFLVKRRSM